MPGAEYVHVDEGGGILTRRACLTKQISLGPRALTLWALVGCEARERRGNGWNLVGGVAG